MKNDNSTKISNASKPMLANRLPSIHIGEKQPVNCEKCNDKLGYQYSDYMSLHYTSFHDSDGKHEGGEYSESSRKKHLATTPYCINCGSKLKFKLIRTESEQTEKKQYSKNSYFV